MSRVEILLTVVLALIGFGLAAGQDFQVNGWVLLFWGMAIVVMIYGLVTRHGEDDGGLDLSEVPMAHPGSGFERLGTLAGAALRGDNVVAPRLTAVQCNEFGQVIADLNDAINTAAGDAFSSESRLRLDRAFTRTEEWLSKNVGAVQGPLFLAAQPDPLVYSAVPDKYRGLWQVSRGRLMHLKELATRLCG